MSFGDWLSRLKKSVKKPFVATQSPDYPQAIGFSQFYGTNAVSTNTSATITPELINRLTASELEGVKAASKEQPDVRIEKKPVEVVAEIIAPTPILQLNDIKGQIEIVQNRLDVLRRYKGQTNDEVNAIRYLKARLKYEKYKDMFPWAVTTNELISKLLNKYKLADRSFGGYSKSVPNEAIEELEKFGKAWNKVMHEDIEPALKLITDYTGPETKKDPILLAESPFGRWWYVLGAWDKEVQIVDEW